MPLPVQPKKENVVNMKSVVIAIVGVVLSVFFWSLGVSSRAGGLEQRVIAIEENSKSRDARMDKFGESLAVINSTLSRIDQKLDDIRSADKHQ